MEKVPSIFEAVKHLLEKEDETFIIKINTAIDDNNLELITKLMLNKENQKIFKTQLEEPSLLNSMVLKNRMEMLQKVLEDPFYHFDETFIFEFLSKKLKEKDKLINDTQSISKFISNIVNYHLYRKSLTQVLGWFIICFGLNEQFINLVKSNQKEYSLDYIQFNHFEKEEDIINYIEEPANYRRILILCLKEKLEQLAIELVIFKGKLESFEVIEAALQYNSIAFLKYIWEASNSRKQQTRNDNNSNHNHHNKVELNRVDVQNINDPQKKSHLITFFENSSRKVIFNKGNTVFMLSDLVEKIYEMNNITLINDIVSHWKFLDRDKNLVHKLLKIKVYDEVSRLLERYPNNPHWKISPTNFKEIIENNGVELILPCLHNKNCLNILEQREIQKIIVKNYLSSGKRLYYGAEMLTYIRTSSLDLSLVDEMLITVEKSVKSRKISDCYSPLLTCLLLCEITSNINEISSRFSLQCEKTKTELMIFCKNLQEACPNENHLKFLLGEKDSKQRTGYQIAAKVKAFMILESPEVGTFVNKMWVGRLRHDGILSFSSLKRFLESPLVKGNNPFKSYEDIDTSKIYFHQLGLWEESCSLRFYPESLSTIFLIVLYNLWIYFLVKKNLIMEKVRYLSPDLQMMLIFYIIWVICIALNIPLQILYCFLSGKRKYKIDFWGFTDIILLIFAFCTLINTEAIFPSRNEYGEKVPSDGKSDAAFVFRAAILSINAILVWLRIAGILSTYKELGPLIRMIYILSIETGKYLLVYLIVFICLGTIYTTLFFKASPLYESYSITFTTLFQGFLNNGDYSNFDYYEMFGAIMCIGCLTVCGLVMVNILIALQSNEYTKLSKQVDAAHRSVLINYYKRYKWDKNFGYLILLTTPLNIINFIIVPVNLLRRKNKQPRKMESQFDSVSGALEHRDFMEIQNMRQREFNEYASKIHFSLFYAPIIILIYAIVSIFLIPGCYIVGIFTSLSAYYTDTGKNKSGNFGILLLWLLFGFPFLLYRYIKDLKDSICTMFTEFNIHSFDLEKKRIKDLVQPEDIWNFIKFINQRERNERNDIHSVFSDFLQYELQNKSEMNPSLRKTINYLEKMRKRGKISNQIVYILLSLMNNDHRKNQMINNKKTYSSRDNNKVSVNDKESSFDEQDEDDSIEAKFAISKRNLILIEILENFLIDDGSDNFIVDIEKMKMLLPKTMNINNRYIKRLVYTGITSLNKAVNKRKNKSNSFLQHKLLNKIVGAMVRLDKTIDGEGNSDPLQTEEAKRRHKFEIEDNEDDFYLILHDLLKKLEENADEDIKKLEREIHEEEDKKKKITKKFSITKKKNTGKSTIEEED